MSNCNIEHRHGGTIERCGCTTIVTSAQWVHCQRCNRLFNLNGYHKSATFCAVCHGIVNDE